MDSIQRKNLSKCPYKIVPLDEALPMPEVSADELKKLKKFKKMDANDLVHELGPDGFRKWLEQQSPIFVHWNNCPAVPVGRLRRLYPTLREPVIHGLLRRGEIMNIIAAPKMGKSILVQNLMMSVITAGDFLGGFACAMGRVLVIDNELHRETIASRVPEVAQVMNIPLERVDRMVDYIPLRGELIDLVALEHIIKSIKPGYYKLIVLDAFYKFMPQDTDENSNANMANLYNLLDRYAEILDSALVLIHHTSKGLQSGRDITDVGAGAGAQSRAADTHLILRPHQEDGAVVIDAAVRSYKPPEPFCARMRYPRWELAPDLDPAQLKGLEGKKEREDRVAEKKQRIEAEVRLKEQLLEKITKPMTPAEIQATGIGLGIKWSKNLCLSWINGMVGGAKLAKLSDQRGSVAATYGPIGVQSETKVASPNPAQTDAIVIEGSIIEDPPQDYPPEDPEYIPL